MNKDEAVARLEDLISFLQNGYQGTGYCMCGSKIEHHGLGDGHSPVDEGLYYVDFYVKGLTETLEFIKNCN